MIFVCCLCKYILLMAYFFFYVDDIVLEATLHTVYSEIVCHNIAYTDMNIT